jgi:hypothetical protein
MTLSINTGSREFEEWRLARFCTVYAPLQRYKNVGLPPAGEDGRLRGGGSKCVHEGDIYFERNMGTRLSTYFGRNFAPFKYFAYYLVPVLDPNYKQHI